MISSNRSQYQNGLEKRKSLHKFYINQLSGFLTSDSTTDFEHKKHNPYDSRQHLSWKEGFMERFLFEITILDTIFY